MGRNNRLRREAKRRKRDQAHRDQAHRDQAGRERHRDHEPRRPAAPRGTPSVAEIIAVAATAARAGDTVSRRHMVAELVDRSPHLVARELAARLADHVGRAWERGWQPADLHRVVGRQLGTGAAAVVRLVVAAEAVAYETLGQRVAPRWMAQIDSTSHSAVRAGEPYLLRAPGEWIETLDLAVCVLGLLPALPELPELVDPPSKWRDGGFAAAGPIPDGVLERVRALLAKAEATDFDAEAEAFTAKAQELMARHRIDRAMCGADRHDRADRPLGRRVGVDDPYADAKALLLAEIAGANDCRAVWSKALGFSTLFGYAHDLDAVEELYTSLLVQANAALRREGSKQDAWGRSRTTRFRRSFLSAFAVRIGERLRRVVADTVAAAERDLGRSLLPVLASRSHEVRAVADAVFPELGQFATRANDAEGWHAGTVFGDVAELRSHPAVMP